MSCTRTVLRGPASPSAQHHRSQRWRGALRRRARQAGCPPHVRRAAPHRWFLALAALCRALRCLPSIALTRACRLRTAPCQPRQPPRHQAAARVARIAQTTQTAWRKQRTATAATLGGRLSPHAGLMGRARQSAPRTAALPPPPPRALARARECTSRRTPQPPDFRLSSPPPPLCARGAMRERRTGRRGGGPGGEGLCGSERTCPTLWQPRARARANTPAMEKYSKLPSRYCPWPAPSPSR